MEDKHERKLIEHVKLKQTIRALTLLTEGYPIAETEGYQEKRTWFWEGDVNAMEGIERFVMGLRREVSILEEERLKDWVVGEG